MQQTFLMIIEVLGTIAFAISGIRLAAAKRFDWFGAYVVGLVTAIGGGTLRDVLLDIPVFWMQSSMYLAVTGISLATVILFKHFLVKGMRTLFTFDAIGLALFVVVGIEKTLAINYPMWWPWLWASPPVASAASSATPSSTRNPSSSARTSTLPHASPAAWPIG